MTARQILLMAGCVLSILTSGLKSSTQKRITLDKILARVEGVNILQSDLEIPRISKDGDFYSLQELITEELFVQKALEKQMVPSQVDVERQIVAFKMQNGMGNISDDEFEEELKKSGFTLKSYKEQLGRLIAMENVKRAEVSERVVVTSQDVQEYYKKNPVWVTEAYHLKMAYSTDPDSKKELKWEDIGWVEKNEIDEQFLFVQSMEVGAISEPIKSSFNNKNQYQFVRLEDKRTPRKKSLDESYIEIEKILYQEQKEEYLKNVEKNIREKASIVYLD